MDEHFADSAALVAALPPDDERRRAAEEHAARCAPCRHALEEASALLALVRKAMKSGASP